MADQKLVEWAKQKLDEGMDEEQIRKALEKSGRDPSIVDKAREQRSKTGEEQEPDISRRDTGEKRDKSVSDIPETGDNRSVKTLSKYLGVFQDFLRSNWKIMAVLIIILVGVSGTGALISSGAFSGAATYLTGLTDFEDGDSSGNQVSDSQRSEYSTPTVFLNEGVAIPSRSRIESGEKLRFVNNVSYGLRVSFESDKESFRLQPGETRETEFISFVYYTASPTGGAEKPGIRGSVVAQ